jgi:hypothetical protein
MLFRERKKMKTKDNRVTTRFGTETGFVAPVIVGAPFRRDREADLDQLKNRLLARELARVNTLEGCVALRQAANEAAALVWLTPYPLLLLPALFEEKARAARLKVDRQGLIRERSGELLALAE